MKPVLFTIGPYNVYTFGVFLCLSFIASTFIIWKLAKEELKEEEYLDLYLYTSIAALLSSRLVFIISNFDLFGSSILKYLVVRETPGLSLIGGLAGAFIYLSWYSWKRKKDLMHTLDIFSIAGSFALFFAKIGLQLGGASFGRETDSALGIKIAGMLGRYHPVELYEAFFYLLLGGFLYYLYTKPLKFKHHQGLIFYIFALANFAGIFLLEFFKTYSVYLYGLSLKQAVAAILFATCMLILGISKKRGRI